MKVIFDYDTMIYKCCYRICSFSDIRNWFEDGNSKDWIKKEIVELSLNRLSQMTTPILEAIEETGIIITSSEYYITTCKNSIRTFFYPEYKKTKSRQYNRQVKWVNLIRKEINYATGDDNWEADDLVIDEAKKLDYKNCIIVSEDKDVNKGCPGLHFDSYLVPTYDDEGNKILDVFENPIKEYRGISYVTPIEAKKFFWFQMLMGDSTDNIKGVPSIGKAKATNILESELPKNYSTVVKYAYEDGFIVDWEFQYNSHLLLIGLGTDRLELINKIETL